MTDLDAALFDATSALLAMRMGVRDDDYALVRDAAHNLCRAAEKAHRLSFILAKTHAKEP